MSLEPTRHLTTVLLDAGETVLHADPSFWGVARTVFQPLGIEVTEVDYDAAYQRAWLTWRDDGPYEASEASSSRRYRRLDELAFEELGHAGLPDAFFRALDEAFRSVRSWRAFSDTELALTSLRRAGFRLAVVSNWAWYGGDVIEALGLADLVDAVTISARVGFSKPHPGIFQHALDQLGVAPGDALHVGDSVLADVGGARAAGLDAVLISRGGDQESARDCEVPVVADLLGLLDLLGVDRA